MLTKIGPILLLYARLVRAQSSSATTTSTSESTLVSQISISTAIASPSGSSASAIPSQFALPPQQAWCPSEVFCAGALLQTVNDADIYSDPKTFVDKPTSKSSASVLADFQNITASTITEGQIVSFVDADFLGERLELEALVLPNFPTDPSFLQNVTDPLLKSWSQTVHGFWSQLIRNTNASALCPTALEGSSGTCEGTLLPLNFTFVIPGGRFRENYYWDSFWIIEGLIQSELYDIVNDMLQNFMDELESLGFIPNGGRIYYLNRSQPPLFIQMLARYVNATNDQSILERALPLAEKELEWWKINRTTSVVSPFTNRTYSMAQYAVNNTVPRPESYLTDYQTAHAPGLNLSSSQLADLYAELASGAESGWDYCSRFLESPAPGNDDLTILVIRETIPVDLNSILYKNHILLTGLYGSSNATAANSHLSEAATIVKLAFYDFSLRTNSRNNVFSVATWYPLWSGIIPDEILSSETNAFRAFSAVNMVMNRYNGTDPTPGYIIIEALRALPSNLSVSSLFTLFGQPVLPEANASASGVAADINALNGTVVNGGNATNGEGWSSALQRIMVNWYMTSVLCSWQATGGSIPGVIPRLSDAELNVTQSINNTGNMFEKLNTVDVDSSGSGGEYTVQAGFGWTNGIVLWVASNYGGVLVDPECPNVLVAAGVLGVGTSTSSATTTTTPSPTSSGTSNALITSPAQAIWLLGLVVVLQLML